MIRLILLRILESYFRHRWLFLLPILLMTGVGAASVLTKTDSYITSSTFYVNKGSFLSSLTSIREAGFSWVTPAQTAVNELNQLKKTNAFIRAVILQTDLEVHMAEGPDAANQTINGVRNSIWFNGMGDNLVLVGAIHEEPEIARQLVEATMEAYIQWQINADREESVSSQMFFADLINTYQAELDVARSELRQYLEANPEPVRGSRPEVEVMEIKQLEDAVTLAATRLMSAKEDEESARLGMVQAESDARQKAFVIDAPKLPTQPASSKSESITQAIIFVVVGVVLTVVGVIGGALIDRSFRFAIDVHNLIDLPVIAQVPDPDNGKKKKKGKKKKDKKADKESDS